MINERLFRLAAVIAALHMILLSLVFGLRHRGYLLTATSSATLIWSTVFFLRGWKRRVGLIAGVVVASAVQRAACQIWRDLLSGYWWPLAQFAALQFLIAFGLWKRVT